MELEEAVERLKYILFIYNIEDEEKINPEQKYRSTANLFAKDLEAIDVVYRELFEAKEANRQLQIELDKKDKVIDLMAKHFYDLDVAARISHTPTIYNFKSVKHAQEWFYGKVEEQE